MKKLLNLLKKLYYIFRKNMWVSILSKLSVSTELEGYNRIFKGADITDSIIGLGSYVGKNTFLPHCDIGRFCAIGPDVKLIRGKHPSKYYVSIHPSFYSTRKQSGFTFVNKDTFEEFSPKRTNIGNDVWIGSDVLIIEGVKIEDGAIVGSGAVVSKDLSAYSINVGNPIKEIGKRFNDNQIKFLIKNKWWEKDINWIQKNFSKFQNIKYFNNEKDVTKKDC